MPDIRYFRTNFDAVYEQTRVALDVAWGHLHPATCIEPVATAPRDAAGRIVLAVNDEFCSFPAAAEVLPGLLASGAVEEIDDAAYFAALMPPRVP